MSGVELDGMEEWEKKIEAIQAQVKGACKWAALAGADVLAAAMDERAPEPGGIRTKLKRVRKTKTEVWIGPSKRKWAWRFYETGAQPHEIKGAPLVFEGDVGIVVTRLIPQHPGIAARPFMRPAVDTAGMAAVGAAAAIFWSLLGAGDGSEEADFDG